MYSDDDLKTIATDVLTKLTKFYSLSEAEVYVLSFSQLMGGTEFRTPKTFQNKHRSGCAIRFFKEGKLYFASFPFATVLAEIESLDKILKYPLATKTFQFPTITSHDGSIHTTFDPRISSLDENEVLSFTHKLKEINDNAKDVIIDGSILLSYERRVIANTSQSLAFEKGTWCNIDFRALYRSVDIIASSESHIVTRKIPVSLDSMVDNIVHEAIKRTIPRAEFKTHKNPVILSPKAFSDLMAFTLVPYLTSSEYSSQSQLEFPYEFSPNFSLTDDGTFAGLPNTTIFDDEGSLQTKTPLINKGKIVNTLNCAQIQEDEKKRTGNAFRFKPFETFPRNYQALPQVFPSNVIVESGSNNLSSLIEDYPVATYINSIQGHLTSDYRTGNFNITAIESYELKNGESQKSLPTLILKGNIFDLLKQNPLFSLERRVNRPLYTPYSIICPNVITDSLSIQEAY